MLLLYVEHTGLKILVLWGFDGKRSKDLSTVS